MSSNTPPDAEESKPLLAPVMHALACIHRIEHVPLPGLQHAILGKDVGGHVRVEDHAIIGGLSAVHQWVRIGAHAMIGGMSGVEADVIPYGTVTGERAHLAGLNIVGMKRRGFSREDMHAVRAAYRRLFLADGGTQAERLAAVEAEFGEVEAVRPLIDFVKAEADRALTRPRVKGGAGDAS